MIAPQFRLIFESDFMKMFSKEEEKSEFELEYCDYGKSSNEPESPELLPQFERE